MNRQSLEPCTSPEQKCLSYARGHLAHVIQLRLLGERPWGWHDGVVSASSAGLTLHVEYIEGGGIVLWHHRPLLGGQVHVGGPVRVHEGLDVLDTLGSGVVCVRKVSGGLGSVPEPAVTESWTAEREVYIADVAGGRGIRAD